MCEYVPVCDNYQCVHVQCNHSGGNDGPGDGLGLLFNFHFPFSSPDTSQWSTHHHGLSTEDTQSYRVFVRPGQWELPEEKVVFLFK